MSNSNNVVGEWIKSSYSQNSGDCVVMRPASDGVDIGDDKNIDGPALHFTKSELKAYFDGIKAGEFDHLTD